MEVKIKLKSTLKKDFNNLTIYLLKHALKIKNNQLYLLSL